MLLLTQFSKHRLTCAWAHWFSQRRPWASTEPLLATCQSGSFENLTNISPRSHRRSRTCRSHALSSWAPASSLERGNGNGWLKTCSFILRWSCQSDQQIMVWHLSTCILLIEFHIAVHIRAKKIVDFPNNSNIQIAEENGGRGCAFGLTDGWFLDINITSKRRFRVPTAPHNEKQIEPSDKSTAKQKITTIEYLDKAIGHWDKRQKHQSFTTKHTPSSLSVSWSKTVTRKKIKPVLYVRLLVRFKFAHSGKYWVRVILMWNSMAQDACKLLQTTIQIWLVLQHTPAHITKPCM